MAPAYICRGHLIKSLSLIIMFSLLGFSVCSTAKLIYCCILDTVTSDLQSVDYGHLFTISPIADLATTVRKSGMTVKRIALS